MDIIYTLFYHAVEVALLTLWFCLMYKIWKYFNFLSSFKGAATTKSHWFWGHLKDYIVDSEAGTEWLGHQLAQHPTYLVAYFTKLFPLVVVYHSETVKLIYKSSFPKPVVFGGVYNFLREWLGDGLLLSSGARWAQQRRLLTPGFHFKVLLPYMEVFNDEAKILVNKWSDESTRGESFEVSNNISQCALETMLRCAFSRKENIQLQAETSKYLESVKTAGRLIKERVKKPWLYNDCVYFLTSSGREFIKHVRYLHLVANDLIAKRREELSLNPERKLVKRTYVDFLDILLLAKGANGECLTDVEIREEVDTFLFEGHDTTSSAITWILYDIVRHPDHLKKCREEIDKIFDCKTSDLVEWDDITEMEYLSVCIKESMRLHSPVPSTRRLLNKPTKIDNHTFPAGTIVEVNLSTLHQHPDIWGDDWMIYNPERFLYGSIEDKDPFAFVPFSAGPRNCIGQVFALHEIKVVVSHVIRNLHLRLDEDYPVEIYRGLVLKPKHGMKFYMEKRLKDDRIDIEDNHISL